MLLHQQNTQRECMPLLASLLPILVCFLTEVDDVQEEVSQVLMLLTMETYGRVTYLKNEIVGNSLCLHIVILLHMYSFHKGMQWNCYNHCFWKFDIRVTEYLVPF